MLQSLIHLIAGIPCKCRRNRGDKPRLKRASPFGSLRSVTLSVTVRGHALSGCFGLTLVTIVPSHKKLIRTDFDKAQGIFLDAFEVPE